MLYKVRFNGAMYEKNREKKQKVEEWIKLQRRSRNSESQKGYFNSWKNFHVIYDGVEYTSQDIIDDENVVGIQDATEYDVLAKWDVDAKRRLYKLLGRPGYVDSRFFDVIEAA